MPVINFSSRYREQLFRNSISNELMFGVLHYVKSLVPATARFATHKIWH